MKDFASCLPSLLRDFASDEDLVLIFLTELWPEIVGKEVADKTRPVLFRNQVLSLRVAGKTWEEELKSLNHLMKATINQYWGFDLVRVLKLVREL